MPASRQLAILGGQPLFSEPLHVGRPSVGNRATFERLVGEVLDRRWFSNNGPLVREFEGRLQGFLGVRHCITVCNATVGLEIAVRAAGLKGEVIVPAYTFVATAHALQWQEVTPVFCDLDPATHNLDPSRVEALITPSTTGIIGVHVWGRPCAVEALEGIARRQGLTLMFDAAHAFGCGHAGRRIGTFGLAEIFSFHATKFFNTFEGGCVATNDDGLAARIRLMKNFGFSGLDNVIYLGTNGKMTEICAAMGLASFDALDGLIATNRANYLAYQAALADLPGLRLIDYDQRESQNFQYIVIELDEQAFGLGRDELVRVLWAENVRARKYFWPGVHRMEPYRTKFPETWRSLPATEALASRVMLLPTGQTVDHATINSIAQVLAAANAEAAEVKRVVGTGVCGTC